MPVEFVLGLAAAVVVLAAALYLHRRPRAVPRKEVTELGLHEGDWFQRWTQENDVIAMGPDVIQLSGETVSYQDVEVFVTQDWHAYDAKSKAQGNERPTFLRSIKVVLRDWHQEAVAEVKKTPDVTH